MGRLGSLIDEATKGSAPEEFGSRPLGYLDRVVPRPMGVGSSPNDQSALALDRVTNRAPSFDCTWKVSMSDLPTSVWNSLSSGTGLGLASWTTLVMTMPSSRPA